MAKGEGEGEGEGEARARHRFECRAERKVWARLRVAGIRTSPRRVLRVMREHALLAHQRVGAARGPRAHDGTITTEKVDEMWGTDLTGVMTGEGTAAVFVAVDHCSAECVGIHASARATRREPSSRSARRCGAPSARSATASPRG